MLVERLSPVDKRIHVIDMNLTGQQVFNWNQGQDINIAMSHLTPEERLFMLTGVTIEQQQDIMGRSKA